MAEGKQNSDAVREPFTAWDLGTAARRIQQGFAARLLDVVQDELDLTAAELSAVLLMSPRTVARRRTQASLSPDESDRVFRLLLVFDRAVEVLGSREAARAWFKHPNFALGEMRPVELVRTAPGARLVEEVLGRIAYGEPA